MSSDALNNPGYSGYFWSSTVYSSSSAYYLYFYSTYVNPANYDGNRYIGWAVRCLSALPMVFFEKILIFVKKCAIIRNVV